MQQSNVIVGGLFIAFIVFVTAKGELPTYISLLRGDKSAAASFDPATMQHTSIGDLPKMIDGAQLIVTDPTASTNSSIKNLNANTQSIEQQAQDLLANSGGIYINASDLGSYK